MIQNTIPLLPSRFAAETESGIAALGVDLKALLLQILTFVIVFLLLKRFALDKIVAALDQRRTTIDQGVELGQEMSRQKQALDQDVQKILQHARLEADKIIASSHNEAAALIKAAEATASHKVEVMLADAHSRIDEDIQHARRGLEKDIIGLVAEATEVLIEEKLDSQKDVSLVQKVLQGVRRQA